MRQAIPYTASGAQMREALWSAAACCRFPPEKSLENEAFSRFHQTGRGGLASSCAIGVAPDVKDEKAVPTGALKIILAGGRQGKMEIPVYQMRARPSYRQVGKKIQLIRPIRYTAADLSPQEMMMAMQAGEKLQCGPSAESWWESHERLVMSIAIYCMIVASVVWLGYQFWRLLLLQGYWGANDLHNRYVEVHDWFSGKIVYGRPGTPTYPPASYVLLWPFLGWVSFLQARWIWAATTVLTLVWFIRLACRESFVQSSQQRMLVALMPLSAYATGATIGNGQLGVHLLPLLVASLLLVARGPAKWRNDLLAAGLFIPALVKPSFSAPFYLLILFLPKRIRPAALIAAGYGALTLLACRFQNGSLLDQMRAWQASVDMSLNGAALKYSHEDLHIWFASLGLSKWVIAASFLVLIALAVWIYLHRHIDTWVLIGVAALVTRFYTYHGWYDDVLLFLPLIALFRIAFPSREAMQGATSARILLGANLLFMIAPGGLYLLPRPLNMIYVAFQTLVWIVLLGFLLIHPRRLRNCDLPISFLRT